MIIAPDSVIAPPAVRVLDPRMKLALESAVTERVPTTITGALVVVVGWAPLTIMAPPVPAEIRCPETVMAEPGARVWDPMMKFEEAS